MQGFLTYFLYSTRISNRLKCMYFVYYFLMHFISVYSVLDTYLMRCLDLDANSNNDQSSNWILPGSKETRFQQAWENLYMRNISFHHGQWIAHCSRSELCLHQRSSCLVTNNRADTCSQIKRSSEYLPNRNAIDRDIPSTKEGRQIWVGIPLYLFHF